MHLNTNLVVLSFILGAVAVTTDSAGYYLPASGVASVTQFNLTYDFSHNGNSTACGMYALPNGKKLGAVKGGGPGYLYAAINQLAFGANPFAGAGGPGGACGLCYLLTPRDSSDTRLTQNALVFRIVDECSDGLLMKAGLCSPCTPTQVNSRGYTFHFNIASDAMDQTQYDQFYNGFEDDWGIEFEKTACGDDSPVPPLKSWGCMSGCTNNDDAGVCDVTTVKSTAKSTVPVVTVTRTVTARDVQFTA